MAAKRKTAKRRGAKRKRLNAWSYSTMTIWDGCPQRAYYGKVEKLPDPLGPAAQRGTEVHQVADDFVGGRLEELPTRGNGKILIPFLPDLQEVMKEPTVKTEISFTFTKDWKVTHWRDWDNAWVRMKLDVLYQPEPGFFVLIDYKTGRKRDYEKQTELYAIGCFLNHASADLVRTEIWYLDHPQDEEAITTFEYERGELAGLLKKWEQRVRPMMEDDVFRPRPSNDCRWCPFSKLKGGPCKVG